MPSDQMEVMLEAQRLVLEDQARQLAAYQRTVLKLLRLFVHTDVPVAKLQAALAEVGPRKDAATLIAEAVEKGRAHGNA